MDRSGSLKIAKIRGVVLELHVSLLLLLPYLVFVTVARFPVMASEAGVSALLLSLNPVLWGFVIAFFLFASVVLHEFGHVFVAQALGAKVRSVTLMMLGGISSIEKVPERPYSEFKLAMTGPLVSLLIAAFFFYMNSWAQSPDLIFLSYWMGSLNLVLAIFNLLPAFPLDGGRALRSVLAARHGMVRATQVSVKISKVFAWVLGVLGLIGFNILLILIAFFIYTAAQGELFFLLSRGILKGLRVRDVFRRVEPLQERDNLEKAAEKMLSTFLTLLPVETVLGEAKMILIGQVRQVPRSFWRVTLVMDVMEKVTRSIDINETMSESFPELTSSAAGALPVLEQGKVVGIIQYSDISQILQVKSLAEPELQMQRKDVGPSEKEAA